MSYHKFEKYLTYLVQKQQTRFFLLFVIHKRILFLCVITLNESSADIFISKSIPKIKTGRSSGKDSFGICLIFRPFHQNPRRKINSATCKQNQKYSPIQTHTYDSHFPRKSVLRYIFSHSQKNIKFRPPFTVTRIHTKYLYIFCVCSLWVPFTATLEKFVRDKCRKDSSRGKIWTEKAKRNTEDKCPFYPVALVQRFANFFTSKKETAAENYT